MKIQIGQSAPDFTLFDTTKQAVRLSEQKGNNVLLLFFPFAFSSVCTAELCSIRDNLQKYEQVDAKVFGISVDSLYALGRFKEDQNLSFSLLSDFNKTVSTLYGALHEKFSYGMEGVSKRSAFVIDRNGIVQYAEVLENPGEQPNFTKILEKLSEITHTV